MRLLTKHTFVSVRRSHVGRSKKFSQSRGSVMKRVHITAETCVKFCQVKKANGFASYECTLQYLLNCNKKRCLQLSAIATDDHGATPPVTSASPLLFYTPVLCSTPSRTPLLSTRYNVQRCLRWPSCFFMYIIEPILMSDIHITETC